MNFDQIVDSEIVNQDAEWGAEISEDADTEFEVENTETEAPSAELEAPIVKRQMGIGDFVRMLLTKSTKSNAEILDVTLKAFPEARTTPACIAWYKSDLRKKGLLLKGAKTGRVQSKEFSPEELAEMIK